MSIDQHDKIISEAGILDVGVLPVARGFFRSLQHSIYLREIDVTEQRRNHAPYTKGNFDRLGFLILRFGADPKESECCGEW